MVIQARKRFVVAFVVALMLAYFAVSLSAQMIPSGCKGLTPSDWEYWFRQCYLYSFAPDHQRPFRGFILR